MLHGYGIDFRKIAGSHSIQDRAVFFNGFLHTSRMSQREDGQALYLKKITAKKLMKKSGC